MTTYDADVAVVGLGALGSMTLWRLASRGVNVIGVEQFGIAHDLGSSHGSTRLFRLACFEHPDLGSMAFHALDLWRELEEISGTELLTLTGGVMIGPQDSELIVGTRQAAANAGASVEELSREELAQRFPVFANTDPSYVGLWDPNAGVLRPEASITAAINAAKARGAQVLDRTKVTAITETTDGVEIRTEDRVIRARSVVVAAGPWISKLLDLPHLTPMRTIMTWFRPTEAALDVDRLPVFIRHIDDQRTIWGHGGIDGLPIKVGAPDNEFNIRPTDPDTIDRELSDGDVAGARDVVRQYFHGIDPEPAESYTCMITFSPDLQFVLGPREPGSKVIIAGGCSGHAFKHASAIGDFLAGSALGEPPSLRHQFVSPERFLFATQNTYNNQQKAEN
ncbi:N-methyl-L-tryptophan oxidase [Pseudarthrobacter sp. NPDC055928]|uniref:N-methyl-L-tryptophan oxidase n=1 Tax=Pseudarthrobacter sp. NPDC055928 TaxID=3345661 RepID=UPI0035E28616